MSEVKTTGAAQAPSSYEELVWTLRHFSDCKRQQNFHATADLLTEAADALVKVQAERDAAVARAEAAEAAIREAREKARAGSFVEGEKAPKDLLERIYQITNNFIRTKEPS